MDDEKWRTQLMQVTEVRTLLYLIPSSLVPRPHPDFISQPWRKIGVGPGDEATFPGFQAFFAT